MQQVVLSKPNLQGITFYSYNSPPQFSEKKNASSSHHMLESNRKEKEMFMGIQYVTFRRPVKMMFGWVPSKK